MPSPLDALDLPFMRTALLELGLLAVAGGLLGAMVVLRRLAFFAHAVGGATFPALVAASAAGISAPAAAVVAALGYAGAVERTGRRAAGDAATALVLAAALALGVVLASDVFHSSAGVDRLLFGSLLGLDQSDVLISAAAAALAIAATLVLGGRWVAAGFDPALRATLGPRAGRSELALRLVIAVCVVASLAAVGALLVSALFVVPAATARLVTRRVPALLAGGVVAAAVDGALGLYVAFWLNLPPGPAVAVAASAVYALVALGAVAGRRFR